MDMYSTVIDVMYSTVVVTGLHFSYFENKKNRNDVLITTNFEHQLKMSMAKLAYLLMHCRLALLTSDFLFQNVIWGTSVSDALMLNDR